MNIEETLKELSKKDSSEYSISIMIDTKQVKANLSGLIIEELTSNTVTLDDDDKICVTVNIEDIKSITKDEYDCYDIETT